MPGFVLFCLDTAEASRMPGLGGEKVYFGFVRRSI